GCPFGGILPSARALRIASLFKFAKLLSSLNIMFLPLAFAPVWHRAQWVLRALNPFASAPPPGAALGGSGLRISGPLFGSGFTGGSTGLATTLGRGTSTA